LPTNCRHAEEEIQTDRKRNGDRDKIEEKEKLIQKDKQTEDRQRKKCEI